MAAPHPPTAPLSAVAAELTVVPDAVAQAAAGNRRMWSGLLWFLEGAGGR